MRQYQQITLNDRGTEKTFFIQEMSALQAQRFLIKGLSILAQCGILNQQIDPNNLGDAAGAISGALFDAPLSNVGAVDLGRIDELVSELLGCCSYIADGQKLELNSEQRINTYIEDLKTLFELEKTAFTMTFNFLPDAMKSENPAKPRKEAKTLTMKA